MILKDSKNYFIETLSKGLLVAITLLWCIDGFSYYSCSARDRQNNNCVDLVKLNPVAGLGQCLPNGVPNEDFSDLFARNNIQVYTGINPRARGYARSLRSLNDRTDPRVIALARVVEAYEKIGDGRMSALRGANKDIKVIFARPGSPARNSRRIGDQIQITPGSQNSTGTDHNSTCGGQDNHALIAHELAHAISWHNRGEILWGYKEYMRNRKCSLSSYSNKNWSEQVAEVIAAYITMPQKFARRDTADCRRAFEYMKSIFGEPNMQMTCQARFQSYRSDGSTWAENLLPPTPSERPDDFSVFRTSFSEL